uniref:Uncharacterized protein n=1 Tax=viral metagenome TaxID=1070528 RepID=A0A6C0CVP5_9ZZZZ
MSSNDGCCLNGSNMFGFFGEAGEYLGLRTYF